LSTPRHVVCGRTHSSWVRLTGLPSGSVM
jgi:hypothetical protein